MEGRVGSFCVRSKAHAALSLFHVVNLSVHRQVIFFLSNRSVDQIATLEMTSCTVTPRAALVLARVSSQLETTNSSVQPRVLITYFLSSLYLKNS